MTAAERQSLRRQRKKAGQMVVKIVVSPAIRDVLADVRWLPEWDVENREEVQRVLQIMVDNMRPRVTRDAFAESTLLRSGKHPPGAAGP